MKFFSIAPLFFAPAAYAQFIAIASPTAGQTLTRGQIFTAEIARPDSSGSAPTQIGIAIGLAHCSQTPCEDHSENIGDVLYAGEFNPVQTNPNLSTLFQSFNVTAPSGLSAGEAVLSVVSATLIGAGSDIPYMEVQNVTVTLV